MQVLIIDLRDSGRCVDLAQDRITLSNTAFFAYHGVAPK